MKLIKKKKNVYSCAENAQTLKGGCISKDGGRKKN